MESLYRKYRPLTFDSVVGQQHIVSTLEHAITEGRLSHAYLFCGPRGTGKTTMARILAKALLCRNAEAARAEGASGCMPDGTCEECELIAEGNHPDVYELDAASRTGVDNVREEIINSVNFAPVRGKYKIYIIDEVHMLTTAAFNALLKTLEEPPAHVIFVLCTTDPQKILETILSRCQRFDFHRIGNEDIEHRLAYVCEQEGFDYDDEALAIVARHAKGGMRDALSTLEQLSVFGNGTVHADDARSLLGEVSDQILGEFSRAIADHDVAELYGLIRAQVEEGNDLLELTRDLVAHVRDVYVACVAGARAELFEGGSERAETLAAEAAAFGEHPADRLARVLTVLDDAALEMRGASDVRLVLEIACTRLTRPEADLTIEALAERVTRLEAMVANAAVPASVAAAQAAAPAAVAAAPAETQQPTLISGARAATSAATAAPAAASAHQGGMPWDRGTAVPAVQPAPRSTAPAPASKPVTPAPQPVAAPAPAPAASTVPVSKPSTAAQVAAAGAAETPAVEDAGELQRKWVEVVERVKARQASYAGLLLNARATADDGSRLTVSFPAGSTFAIKMLGRADTQSVVLPTVSAVFGRRTVDYVLDGGGTPAPQHEEHSPSARAAVSADPQPVSSAAPVSSSASAPQQQATPVMTPTPSAPKPATLKPAAPASAPKPVAPASKSSDLGKAPWLRSDNPAGAPATGKLPTEPAPRAPERASAPKAQPAAPSAPWESEQVPYDDVMVGGFAADAGGDDLPPFDVSAAASAPKSSATAPKEEDAPAAPWESNPGAGSPFGHQGAAPSIPQTEDEAKALIRSVFGQATIFKPVE
ncbi:DNA polymerase III subunit gamma/tau [Collinsella sp. BIOML-A4]|uniref:DNA polymerase III subunit gamma/tau n=1 Tax=unclassified Collinsella TaxID=2637548 RepID=UPI0013702815|nr:MULTISPECIES: DNA polymerase III subunit gamma/tau [unclassified Collinsella]MZJ32846.1 DNA polymerase III subunit gamma/tau [Collinsella sp. BIOML-A1]MZJ26994.1 DNA polymerase III subunit gamma/tau [Collinsella sp. BIOML-A2]MZJ29067.1 DNA polymerase III subunit gamma/tau [Collinsella sp. BIOML-A3]MZJ96559.1 DNA polymerase III subunit gamma/tau [Collinsella sp. BIOML-A6]MZK30365.1 DNA polymerase III subunit gamma/tau [Collinsella sp. BIOML-A5]